MLLFCLYHKAGGDASGENIFEHNEGVDELSMPAYASLAVEAMAARLEQEKKK